MKHTYTIQSGSAGGLKRLRRASAWVAYEQHNRLARQGRKVMILNHAGEPVTIGQLEAAVQAETGNAVASTEESGSTPISARNLLMGS